MAKARRAPEAILVSALRALKRIIVLNAEGRASTQETLELESVMIKLQTLNEFKFSEHPHLNEIVLRKACWAFGVSGEDSASHFRELWRQEKSVRQRLRRQAFRCLFAIPISVRGERLDRQVLLGGATLRFLTVDAMPKSIDLAYFSEELRRDSPSRRPVLRVDLIYVIVSIKEQDALCAANSAALLLDQVRALLNFMLVRYRYTRSSPRYRSASEVVVLPVIGAFGRRSSEKETLYRDVVTAPLSPPTIDQLDLAAAVKVVRLAHRRSANGVGAIFLDAFARYQEGIDSPSSHSAFLFYYQSVEVLLAGLERDTSGDTLQSRVRCLLGGDEDKVLLYAAIHERRNAVVHKGVDSGLSMDVTQVTKIIAEQCLDSFYRFVRRGYTWEEVQAEYLYESYSAPRLGIHRRAVSRVLVRIGRREKGTVPAQ